MEGKLKFGLVGCGNIGKRHAEIINELGVLVAVCDNDIIKLTEFTTKYHSKGYESYEVLLQNAGDIEVMVICTPNYLHAPQSIMALNAGLHVLCEKPMALNYADCLLMIEAAEKKGKILHIVKQNRFNPPVIKLKELIENGTLGKVFSVRLNCFWHRNNDYYQNAWRGTKELDGGTLFTQFSHFIDLLNWLFGEIYDLKAYRNNYNHNGVIEYEDTGVVILKFKNGGLGAIHYTINAFEKNMEGSITVFGEKGTIKIGGQYLNELEYQSLKTRNIG
ncbi:MAG: Gfo/Idh/MocA family oxidoreductase [Chitinophagaceae bacterium]|jgi:predicted dehydrogenase|nr:Gfo/Idh/MocA family oxidoreductase [Chitinophagaceae bacterium]